MKRRLLTAFFILFAIATTNYAEAKEIEGEYEYFTQSKNITNLNTQLPANKGLLKVIDGHKIKSTGSYQTLTKPPKRYLRINIEIEKEGNKISIGFGVAPDNSRINHRIPIFQQIYKEDSANTHVYLILPQEVILTEEFQIIQIIDHEKEQTGYLYAVPPENTQLSGLLRKINASMEGTYDLTKDEKSEMERTFDNVADAIGGKTGKGIKIVKGTIKWGMKRAERKRIEYLQKKYGDGYQIHKIPFHVPEGISLSYSHIGRVNLAFINTSNLTESQKAFVEIPQLTYELTTNGSARKASLEGMAYEIMLHPTTKPIPSDPTNDMKFVRVEGGCYQMGDTFGDGGRYEKPVHDVCVDEFYMGKYEVTQEQWEKIMGNNPSKLKNEGNYPVKMVSWNDVQEFIQKMNQRSGKTYRLPTEAEWEYAARSGGKKEKYAGSNALNSAAWHDGNSGHKPHSVGKKQPNGLGIYDMSGNMSEWCSDRYDEYYYRYSSRSNPQGPSFGSTRVARGGSWRHIPRGVTAAYRQSLYPDTRKDSLGFRLVMSPSKKTSTKPEVEQPPKIIRDGHFVGYDNGIVEDTSTGLMWASKDNGGEINWSNAQVYCEKYKGGGYTDWRMPTQDELVGLYDKNIYNKYGFRLIPLINMQSKCSWASDTQGHKGGVVCFGYDRCYRGWESRSYSGYRVLPVRSDK